MQQRPETGRIDRLRLFLIESPIEMASQQSVSDVQGSVKRVLVAQLNPVLLGIGELARKLGTR
jgi:hypothetical protein